MASVSPVITKLARGVFSCFWEAVTENDTVVLADTLSELNGGPSRPDKSVQVTGTFTTQDIEGSNDGTNFVTLTDAQGSDLQFSAAGIRQILENPRYIRPKTPVGASSDVDITIIYRSGGGVN